MKQDKDFLIPSNVFTKDRSGIYSQNNLISDPFSFERALDGDFTVAKLRNVGDEETKLTEEIFIASNLLCVKIEKSRSHKRYANYTHDSFTKVVENYNAAIVYNSLNEEGAFVLHVFLPLGYTVTSLAEYTELRRKAETAFRNCYGGFFKADVSCPIRVRHDFSDAVPTYNLSFPSVMKLWMPKLKNDPLHGMVHGIDAEKISKNAKKGKIRRLVPRSTVEELNAKHAVVRSGGKTLILSEKIEDNGVVIYFTTKRDMADWYANRFPNAAETIKQWMSHPDRRSYEKIEFWPGKNLGGRIYNLWKGYQFENQEGDADCSLYLKHIAENIAGGDPVIEKYILDWMATLIQDPCSRPGVAIGLRGSQGTGKSVFVTIFGELFGEHFVHATASKHLVGQYNAHLQKSLLVFSDEAFNSGSKAAESILKTLISEDTRLIESKGKDVVTVKNFSWLILASNEENIVPATVDDRRFCIVDVGEGRKKDREFFSQMISDMKNGGYRSLLKFLRDRDISGVDLTIIPETEAKKDVQLANMEALPKWWHDKLCKGVVFKEDEEWPGRVLVTRLYEDFKKETRLPENNSVFGKKFLKMAPGIINRRLTSDSGKKESFYILPSLEECRKGFEDYIKMELDWP